MDGRERIRLSFASVVALAGLLALAGPAAAGPPGRWTKVTGIGVPDPNTLEVGLARTPNGILNVLWSRDKTVLNTQVSANAKTLSGPFPVFTYESPTGAASRSVALLPAAGGLRAFFSGLYPMHPLDAGLATATSTDGKSWVVQPTLASDGRTGMRSSVYAAAGIGGAIAGNRVPISIWGDSAPGQAGYHMGLSDTVPDVHFAGPSATVGGPNAAVDTVSGRIAIAWNDLDSRRVLVQSLTPPVGPAKIPVSSAPDALERVAMTGRIGGSGIYVAFLRGGNPFTSSPAVWRVLAPKAIVISTAVGARFVGVAAAPSRRLWAFWARSVRGVWRMFAARSNPAATRFGSAVTIRPPTGTSAVFSLEGEGTASQGALDLLALVQRGGSDLGNWHQRVLPGLTLLARPLGAGAVLFSVLDAGAAVNARVSFAGTSAMTGADGKVAMSAAPGTRTARATLAGHQSATRSVRVR